MVQDETANHKWSASDILEVGRVEPDLFKLPNLLTGGELLASIAISTKRIADRLDSLAKPRRSRLSAAWSRFRAWLARMFRHDPDFDSDI